MRFSDLSSVPVLVVGAGVMGSGIAQVAAMAGHRVQWHDNRPGRTETALITLRSALDRLVSRGRITSEVASESLDRILPLEQLDRVAGVSLVIEAVVEDLGVKRELFTRLEDLIGPDAILATNTSSLSVTAIAHGLDHPERVVGMHFFNPAPVMKLVEVVSGLDTDSSVEDTICDLAVRWDKIPVRAASTPGFIVNRIARPFYAEALELLHERVCEAGMLDDCMRGAGFRMGPCELMDLIGLDTNLAVTRSVYEANFMDRRYKPSVLQQAMVDGGRLGRKSGHGFYRYPSDDDGRKRKVSAERHELPQTGSVLIHGRGVVADLLLERVQTLGLSLERLSRSDWVGLETSNGQLRLTDGCPATVLGENLAVFDLPVTAREGIPLAMSCSARSSLEWKTQSTAWMVALGFSPRVMEDVPGLIVARTIAMLINEAADAVLQGVCSEADADHAMKLGVNYPMGPFEWLDRWGVTSVVRLLDSLDAFYRGERYRVSPLLRQRSWIRNA